MLISLDQAEFGYGWILPFLSLLQPFLPRSMLASSPAPSSRSGTLSLPWLGGSNLLQAAGPAERSPCYLDRGSQRKSYQSKGVFKYSRNYGNHFLLSLWPQPPTLKAPPSVPRTFLLSGRPPPFPVPFFPPGFSEQPPSSQAFPPLVSS